MYLQSRQAIINAHCEGFHGGAGTRGRVAMFDALLFQQLQGEKRTGIGKGGEQTHEIQHERVFRQALGDQKETGFERVLLELRVGFESLQEWRR